MRWSILAILLAASSVTPAPAQAAGPSTGPTTRPATRPATEPSQPTRPAADSGRPVVAPAPARPAPSPGGGLFGWWGNRDRGRNFRPATPPGGEGVPENLKAQLGSTDEEWKVINMLLRKVILARRSVEPDQDPFFARFRPPDRFWDSGNPLAEAKKDLQAALDDRNTPPDLLNEKLQVYRAQRDKARADLAALENELRDLLTVEQQALMVQLGYLE